MRVLSDLERSLLIYYCLNAQASCKDIARKIGSKEHSVRRTIQRLSEQKIILPQPVPMINPKSLGLLEYQLFLTTINPEEGKQQKLIECLCSCRNVKWLGSLGGKYDLDVLIYAESPLEISNIVKGVAEEVGTVRFAKDTATDRKSIKFAII